MARLLLPVLCAVLLGGAVPEAAAELPPQPGAPAITTEASYRATVDIVALMVDYPPGDLGEASRRLNDAWALMSYGDTETASRIIRTSLPAVPANNKRTTQLYAQGLMLSGWAELMAGNAIQARQIFGRLIADYGDSLSRQRRSTGVLEAIRLGLADSLREDALCRDALRDYEALAADVRSQPAYWEAVMAGMADCHRTLGNLEQAESILADRVKRIDLGPGYFPRPVLDQMALWADIKMERDQPDEALRFTGPLVRAAEARFGDRHPFFQYSLSLHIRAQLLKAGPAGPRPRETRSFAEALGTAAERFIEYIRARPNGGGSSLSRMRRSILGTYLTVATWSASRADPADIARVVDVLSQTDLGRIGQIVGNRFAAGSTELARLLRQEQDAQRAYMMALSTYALRISSGLATANEEEERLRRLQGTIRQTQNRIARLDPRFARFAGMSLADQTLQKTIGGDQAVLAYAFGTDAAYVYAVTAETATLARLPAPPQEIEALVAAARRSILDDPDVDPQALRRLRAVLLGPVEDIISDRRKVFLVKDGPLHILPFAALLGPGVAEPGRYAQWPWEVTERAYTVLPSLSALSFSGLKSRSKAPGDFLGIGAPQVENAERAKRSARIDDAFRGRSLAPLPEARAELEGAAQLFPSDKKTLLVGAQATEQAVRAAHLKDYRIVHFATHAVMPGEQRGIDEPSIALTSGPSGDRSNDGWLTASEFFGLQLDADWIVLSACNTATPSERRGVGVSALVRGGMYAGSRALLASHWSVNDTSTAVMLRSVLTAYVAGEPVSEGLQAISTALAGGHYGERFSHPKYWAPFEVFGAK